MWGPACTMSLATPYLGRDVRQQLVEIIQLFLQFLFTGIAFCFSELLLDAGYTLLDYLQ